MEEPHLLRIRITIYRALPIEDDGMALIRHGMGV